MKTNKVNYWSIIKACNWKKDHDYKRISNFLQENYTLAVSRRLQTFCYKQIEILYKRLEKHSELKTGDNYGYFPTPNHSEIDDLVCHIFGLGEDEYNRVMENPELAFKRAKKKLYKENFMFSFHFIFN